MKNPSPHVFTLTLTASTLVPLTASTPCQPPCESASVPPPLVGLHTNLPLPPPQYAFAAAFTCRPPHKSASTVASIYLCCCLHTPTSTLICLCHRLNLPLPPPPHKSTSASTSTRRLNLFIFSFSWWHFLITFSLFCILCFVFCLILNQCYFPCDVELFFSLLLL